MVIRSNSHTVWAGTTTGTISPKYQGTIEVQYLGNRTTLPFFFFFLFLSFPVG